LKSGADIVDAFSIDADALAQILTNLFSNAEKYAAEGGCLDLKVSSEAGAWRLLVSDRGPGVKPGSREKIFEPFRRSGDSINEGVTGTGLGLTIARDLAREMNGDLRLIDSKEGATFEFTLPLAKS
jgi:signal transduction histidine kinase